MEDVFAHWGNREPLAIINRKRFPEIVDIRQGPIGIADIPRRLELRLERQKRYATRSGH